MTLKHTIISTLLPHVDKKPSYKSELMMAQKLVRQSPTCAKGYLDSGQIYKRQNNLYTALSIYEQGLRAVTSDDPRYAELEKEAHDIMASLTQHTPGFRQLLPYDILCIIFGMLEFRDLLRCTGVCQGWCNFILDWPEFWRQLSVELPQVSKKTPLRRQVQEFRLVGPMDPGLMRDMLVFLTHLDKQHTQKLYFRKLYISEKDLDLLVRVLRSTSPPATRVEFVDCRIFHDKVINPILEACSNFSHVSFSRTTVSPLNFGVKRPTWTQVVVPRVSFSSLTYLKLCFEYQDRPYHSSSQTGRLSGILRRCPNLVHLFLDSGGSIHQGHCIRQAIKYCPRLLNLIVSDKAIMPATVVSKIDTSEYLENQSEVGIRRLVLTGGRIKCAQNDIVSVFNKVSSSIKLLHLHYASNHINPSTLYKLAQQSTLQLREIRLSTEYSAGLSSNEPSVTKVLAKLFSRCPLLEVIKIIDTTGLRRGNDKCFIYVDDEVLTAIAEHCPQIHYLQVLGQRRHTAEGILQFATIGACGLIYLEIDVERKIILPLIQRIPSLQRLNVRKDSNRNEPPIPPDEKPIAQRILRERGGSLTIA
ncbi:hypothetical protein BJV82DRAFT_718599 [Fennellomyces sp. T-0311]|nr:hypothetical protein BJV82DRAFT_718599 [Fennellomyces sp. T-0311]